ncbi:LptF/LptG family permease [Pontimicrobium sp. IMCC45349]|uniref:LptF/LptG family permease n=1 Tax=Pontimicrobium sp. IMCC45349 TaxID=3391574 RepID=UPI0039A38982
MKILDKYILTTYLKTFFSVFVILMLIFLLQSIWLYIAELAGKDLEMEVVGKFLLFVSPRLIVLVLPLTILLSSIMVFGSFAENYEFAAMKSTGISLQRAMRSLSLFIIGLAVTTFFFANNVIPWAEYNFYNLRKNIAKVKPALAIAEGQFNQLADINIKVAKKSGDRGQFLHDVTIHQKKGNRAGNYTVIKSTSGEFVSSEESDILQLILFDGNYYDDLQPKDYQKRTKNKPQVKSYFEKYILNVDLSQINNVDFEKKEFSTKYTMLDITALDTAIDSLVDVRQKSLEDLSVNMLNRSTSKNLNTNIKLQKKDTVFNNSDFLSLFKPRKKVQLIDLALNSVNSTKQIIKSKTKILASSEKNINKHIISFYEKFALGFACIILFFVGAPLGALIKKGGMGLPIVIAIVIFLTYHFIGIFAKNSAEDSSLNPILATWLSTLIMLPISIYLTSRATKDRALLDLDSLIIPLKKLIASKAVETKDTTTILDKASDDYASLNSYSDDKLVDIIKNYRQYGIDESFRNTSLNILATRGISEEELRLGGKLVNENYENAARYKLEFDENSKLTLILYIIYAVLGISGAILNNNGFPTLGPILVAIGIIAIILFFVAFTKTITSQSNFYKIHGKKVMANAIPFVILGIPLYFLYNIYFSKKMKEDLKQIR